MECNHVNSIPLDSKRRQTLVEKVREEEGQWRCAERSTWKATVLVLGGGRCINLDMLKAKSGH